MIRALGGKMVIVGKILCFVGMHTWINNVDERGLAGEHRCKYCNKLGWSAIRLPKPPSRPKRDACNLA